jgi:2-amino-4-hydroxy-6-hydroxymethyldihydropteridine diphosphokinase
VSSRDARHAAWIGIGANLGDPARHIAAAVDGLKNLPRTRLAALSATYRTAPVGGPEQPDYFNAVARIDTALDPDTLLHELLALERDQGRTRSTPNAPRTLDLDLLLYSDRIISLRHLTVPHPRMHLRRFVLEPLLEIDPDCIIPGIGAASDWHVQTLDQNVEKIAP